MSELKCLGGCSDREASELESKICWFSADLWKYSGTARLEPWRRSAMILSREAVPPEVLEPIRRQLGVAHRVLNVAVAQIGLERPRVVPAVGEGEPCRGTCGTLTKEQMQDTSVQAPALDSPLATSITVREVCFVPVSGHRQAVSTCPKRHSALSILREVGLRKSMDQVASSLAQVRADLSHMLGIRGRSPCVRQTQ